MIVGESITHGWEGDYTWRSRLWEWFQTTGVNVDFVGPYTGTKLPVDDAKKPIRSPKQSDDTLITMTPDNDGGYAADVSPDFDNNHCAVWGRQIEKVKARSGANFRRQCTRGKHPNLKFALANVPQRSLIKGSEDIPIKTDQYNELLAAAILKWSSEVSPVKLVQLRENYSSQVKPMHEQPVPSRRARTTTACTQTQWANTKSRNPSANKVLSIPNYMPERPCAAPLKLRAEPAAEATNVTWDTLYGAFYGAFGYDLQTRKAGENWRHFSFSSLTNHYETVWTVDGKRWDFRVRTMCGEGIDSEWSEVVSATGVKGGAGSNSR
ncbi:uncharacterized protein BCR38DRAFT_477589 [Pseudomassariella vexata]|uniref:Fibronectin type-III domain-containing protein n=1 Tax=Pseudomassariella vexata TaxID=1141098 RepID=A0A1Y2DHL7_9PEZI|nr:uncharacterized protein BCR38DRAFT_477589 [Pseudomassariella vexata]ORY58741.1 hypothetical protein BCR38DRAFT_477589 [Pseudomassariella vexata]